MTTSTPVETVEYTLTAKASRPDADQLLIQYEFTNSSPIPVYLFNRLARKGGSSVFDIDPDTVNSVLSVDRVTIGKALLPVPEDKEVERQYIPCLTRLASHETYRESILLELPLSPFTWYASRLMKRTPVQRPLFFEIGYAVASSQTEELIRLINTEYGNEYSASWFPLEFQSLISTGPLLTDVAVFSER